MNTISFLFINLTKKHCENKTRFFLICINNIINDKTVMMKNSVKILAPVILLILIAFITPKAKLMVSSSAFVQNGMIPAKYSCQGAEVSPPLTIVNVPAVTKSLAIIVHDPDAPHPGGVYHWVAWNLPADGNITENFKGGNQGLNSDHKTGYKGMCPGEGTHHYNFKVYALDIMLQLDTAITDNQALLTAMQGHIIAQGELTGLFSKGK